jgi:hypothetical protein
MDQTHPARLSAVSRAGRIDQDKRYQDERIPTSTRGRERGRGQRADLVLKSKATPAVGLLDQQDDRLLPFRCTLNHRTGADYTGVHRERNSFTDKNGSFHWLSLPWRLVLAFESHLDRQQRTYSSSGKLSGANRPVASQFHFRALPAFDKPGFAVENEARVAPRPPRTSPFANGCMRCESNTHASPGRQAENPRESDELTTTMTMWPY